MVCAPPSILMPRYPPAARGGAGEGAGSSGVCVGGEPPASARGGQLWARPSPSPPKPRPAARGGGGGGGRAPAGIDAPARGGRPAPPPHRQLRIVRQH